MLRTVALTGISTNSGPRLFKGPEEFSKRLLAWERAKHQQKMGLRSKFCETTAFKKLIPNEKIFNLKTGQNIIRLFHNLAF